MAWFGPKGMATMTFSLLVLCRGHALGERIFNLAALCVFASVLAHGLDGTRRAPRVGWPGVKLGVEEVRPVSSAFGNAQAAWRRRSWLNTKRICWGGRKPSG